MEGRLTFFWVRDYKFMHVVLKSYYSGLFSFTIPTAHLTKRVVFPWS